MPSNFKFSCSQWRRWGYCFCSDNCCNCSVSNWCWMLNNIYMSSNMGWMCYWSWIMMDNCRDLGMTDFGCGWFLDLSLDRSSHRSMLLMNCSNCGFMFDKCWFWVDMNWWVICSCCGCCYGFLNSMLWKSLHRLWWGNMSVVMN